MPIATPKYGEELIIGNSIADIQSLIEKYKQGCVYNQTFHHPKKWTGMESADDERYLSLVKNLNGDIVSYFELNEKRNLILLPQFKDKRGFILDFLSKVAPTFYPMLFPYSTAFNWKREQIYWLPNQSKLIEEKEGIAKEFRKKSDELEMKIASNANKFSFLHEIISETGDQLTNALIRYFKWLEFGKVEKHDKKNESTGVLEEDIQININEGLLIIECKGIGGTSTDADCSQISKIKHRRSKERGKFDVYALYIVNHQRYLPPLKRQNPPFTVNQKQDAINDERGLLTTWQLFNLYFDIENGVISKQEVKQIILNYGFIEFRPIGLTFVYEPTEIFNEGKVCIVNIKNITLKINDELIIEKNGKFKKAVITGIQENNKSISEATNGELGLRLNTKITKKCIMWKRNDS